MLISHSHKFVTIDIPKTGTRSLRETLYPLGIIDVVGGPLSDWEFSRHETVVDLKSKFLSKGWDWSKYVKFSIIRNPWERYVSHMLYNVRKGEEYLESTYKERKTWSEYKLISGEKNIRWMKTFPTDKSRIVNIISKYPPQYWYLQSGNPQTEIDIIASTDTLEEGIKLLCDRVGITNIPKLKHSNKGVYPLHYSEYYDSHLAEIVRNKERWAIAYSKSNSRLHPFLPPFR